MGNTDDSFDELEKKDESKYEVLFYNFKLYLEEIHEAKSRNLKAFEKWRYAFRHNPFVVVLEGYCYSCTKYSIVAADAINYLKSFANTHPKDRANHTGVKCPNPECNNKYLDLEFITNVRIITSKTDTVYNKKKPVILRVFEDRIDIVGTIFERTTKDYTIRSKRLQAILIYLLDNHAKFFKTREIQNSIIRQRQELFNSESSKTPSDDAEDFYKQFVSYIDAFEICNLIEVIQVQSENNKSLMVEAYRITKFGKNIALIAKTKRDNWNTQLFNDVYQRWKEYFEDEPFSLDHFCKKYFQDCKEANLLEDYIKIFVKHFFERHEIFGYSELFSQMIFFRFDNDDSKNENLYFLWKNAMLSLKEDRVLFF
jgi:hypothetical protein